MRTSHVISLAGAAALAAVAATTACGGSNSSPSNPSNGGGTTCTALATSTTITIVNNTLCPQNVTVSRGAQVTFVNSDSRIHEMNSDPHPEHTDCPEINSVGHLEPGQSRQTSNLTVAKKCGFHDHLNFEVASLKGSITIQ